MPLKRLTRFAFISTLLIGSTFNLASEANAAINLDPPELVANILFDFVDEENNLGTLVIDSDDIDRQKKTYTDPLGAVVVADAQLTNGGTLYSYVSLGNSTTRIESNTSLSYQFYIDGPDNYTVPVTITSSGYTFGESYSFISIISFDNNIVTPIYSHFFSGDFATDVKSLDLTSGMIYYLALQADVSGPGDGIAFIDPSLVVDRAFASRFRVIGVPGAVDSVDTVPEPASWAMFIAGFGLIGGLSRVRRGAAVRA